MTRRKPRCFPCEARRRHLWHDDGTVNKSESQGDYRPGGKYGRPLYDGEKVKEP